MRQNVGYERDAGIKVISGVIKIPCKERMGKKLKEVVHFALCYSTKFCQQHEAKTKQVLKQAGLHKRERQKTKIFMLCSFFLIAKLITCLDSL